MLKSILPSICFFLLQNLSAQSTWYTTGQNADLMVSGVDFNNSGSNLYFNHPNGLATDGTHFLVCDRFNNRILIWNTLPSSSNTAPDLVLGQPNFVSNTPGTAKNQLNWAGNASLSAQGQLAVADTENDRILLWNHLPTYNGQPADVSLFLPGMTLPGAPMLYGWPWGVWTDGNRVAAVATSGGAILFWNHFPTADNTPPDYVLKLPAFGTPRNISTDGSSYFFVGDHNAKVNGKPGTFFWNTYPTTANQPYDFYRDEWIKGEKLPDGKLVAGGLSALYIWDTMPTSGAQNPDLVLQPPMYKNGDGVDVVFAQNKLYANNYNGNNVLVFNQLPSQASQLPDFSIGAPGINDQTLDSLYYIQNPVPLTDGKRLVVPSDFDRAIYIWDDFPDHSGQPYDHRIQMPANIHLWAAALHGNTLAVGARNTLSVWKDASNISATPSSMFVNQIGAALLNDIRGLAMDDQFFYLATQSGKIYVWKGIPTNSSQNPLWTLSSTSGAFGYLSSDGEYLCAARPEQPTGVDIYRIADLVAGVTTPFKTISSNPLRINQVSQAVTFNGSLALSSRGDHRVLLWKEMSDWGNASKAIVLGQPDVNAYDAAIGANRLFMPNALLPRNHELWIGEFKFSSRILKFSYGTTAAPEANTEALSAQVFPNPVKDAFCLKMNIPKSNFYKIDLLDVSGRLIHPLFAGKLTAGELYNQSFSAHELPWASGIYLIRISSSGGRTVVKLVR